MELTCSTENYSGKTQHLSCLGKLRRQTVGKGLISKPRKKGSSKLSELEYFNKFCNLSSGSGIINQKK